MLRPRHSASRISALWKSPGWTCPCLGYHSYFHVDLQELSFTSRQMFAQFGFAGCTVLSERSWNSYSSACHTLSCHNARMSMPTWLCRAVSSGHNTVAFSPFHSQVATGLDKQEFVTQFWPTLSDSHTLLMGDEVFFSLPPCLQSSGHEKSPVSFSWHWHTSHVNSLPGPVVESPGGVFFIP